MDARLYTLHEKGAKPLVAVEDRLRFLALLAPPLWALFTGWWLILVGQVLLVSLAWLWSPVAAWPVMEGLGLILGLEAGALIRWELRLRGWREAAVVEARSPEGAEELYLMGEVA